MTNTEIYYSLFVDALSSNLLVFLNSEYVIWVVNLFNHYSTVLILFCSVFGFLLASIINYMIGKLIYKIYHRFFTTTNNTRYQNLKIVLDKYWFVILLALLLPIVHRFTFILFGFCQIYLGKILILGSCIKLIYYMYYIF